MIIDELLKKDLEVIAYDPLAMDNARSRFGDNILYASSVEDCFSNSSIVVITTQADEFKSIDDSYIVHNPTTIVDCWRMLEPSRFGKKVKYVALGKAM
jgi:UDPglucose 6-dehydrogenase